MNRPFWIATLAMVGGAAASVQAQQSDDWLRSGPADGSYSIATPCTAAQVMQQSVRPLVVNGRTLDPGTNVSCILGESAFSSGIISVAAEEIGEQTLFDLVRKGVEAQKTDQIVITVTEIDGAQAILSREVRGSAVAQTGIVELANHKLLMIISGGEGASPEVTSGMIDRHVQSLKVSD